MILPHLVAGLAEPSSRDWQICDTMLLLSLFHRMGSHDRIPGLLNKVFDQQLEKLPPFSSSFGGLQPSAALVGPFRPSQ